jgi:hypothetical protein
MLRNIKNKKIKFNTKRNSFVPDICFYVTLFSMIFTDDSVCIYLNYFYLFVRIWFYVIFLLKQLMIKDKNKNQ